MVWNRRPIWRVSKGYLKEILSQYDARSRLTCTAPVKKLRLLAARTDVIFYSLTDIMTCLFSVNDGKALKGKHVLFWGVSFFIAFPYMPFVIALVKMEQIEEREGKKISYSEGLSLAFKAIIRRRGTSKAFRKLIGYCLGGDYHHQKHMLPIEKITKLYALYQTREEQGFWDDACIKIVLELDDAPIDKIAALRKLWFCQLKYQHLKIWNEENTQQIIDGPDDGMGIADELIANIRRSEAEREEKERAQREERERAQREAFNEERRRRNNRNQERAKTKPQKFTPSGGQHPGLFQVPVRAVSDEERKELHELKQHLRMFKVTDPRPSLLDTTLRRIDNLYKNGCVDARGEIDALLGSDNEKIEYFLTHVKNTYPSAISLFSQYEYLEIINAFKIAYEIDVRNVGAM